MDWKLFASTFLAVFLAEMGDKTQLATLSLAAGSASRWPVFAAAALALVATTAIAVAGATVIGRWIDPTWLRRVAGVIMVALGLVYLFSRSESPPQDSSANPS